MPSVQGRKLCRSGASKEGMIVAQMTIRILDLLVPAWLAERQLQLRCIRCRAYDAHNTLHIQGWSPCWCRRVSSEFEQRPPEAVQIPSEMGKKACNPLYSITNSTRTWRFGCSVHLAKSRLSRSRPIWGPWLVSTITATHLNLKGYMYTQINGCRFLVIIVACHQS